jgi:hypothetical protein
MRDLAGVVLLQARPKIARDTDVVPFEIVPASKDVHIPHANISRLAEP